MCGTAAQDLGLIYQTVILRKEICGTAAQDLGLIYQTVILRKEMCGSPIHVD